MIQRWAQFLRFADQSLSGDITREAFPAPLTYAFKIEALLPPCSGKCNIMSRFQSESLQKKCFEIQNSGHWYSREFTDAAT